MTWADVGKIVISVVVSLGGASGIALLVIKTSANAIAEAFTKKYQHLLDEELEAYKTTLNKKNHITKTRFDTEFQIYRILSKKFFKMAKDIYILIPIYGKYPVDKEEREKKEKDDYDNALRSVVDAQDELNGDAPFISEDFFRKYKELLGLANLQLEDFSDRWNVGYLVTDEEKRHIGIENYKRTKEIEDKLAELNGEIRLYLSSLDVTE